jgi:hypothetical protein
VLGVVQPPGAGSRLIRPADLPRECHSCCDKKRYARKRGEDEQCPLHAGPPGWKGSCFAPLRVGDQRHHADGEDGSEEWLEGKDDRASHNDCTCEFDDQECPPRSIRESEQYTGSDRVDAAGDGEEPAIQFRAFPDPAAATPTADGMA